jgi:hypothetical protein
MITEVQGDVSAGPQPRTTSTLAPPKGYPALCTRREDAEQAVVF